MFAAIHSLNDIIKISLEIITIDKEKIAKEFENSNNLKIVNSDGANFQLDEKCDYIFSLGVIHHIKNPVDVLTNIRKHLKENGKIIIWVYGHENNLFYTKEIYVDESRSDFIIGARSEAALVQPGESANLKSNLYVGPKLQKELEKLADGLELTIDYGVLTFISKPLFWLLDKIYSFIGNWGWAIILLTLLIKLAFYKLSETSYKSMAKMKQFSPKIQSIRERYGSDRQKMNQAMMDMYRQEKINPLGGCWPILIQIPVFIALYWVLLESVELRQADFIFWLDDLSAKDPYYVLPLIMGASMYFQQKLNPTPPDPMQAKVMQMLPIIFTAFFAFFPSGLVLYWVVNNLLSIAQQWKITKAITSQ